MTSTLSPSLCFCVLLSVSMATTYATPLTRVEEYDPDHQDSFTYDVYNAVTADMKSQQEFSLGDVVRGSYSLLVEPDGYIANSHRELQPLSTDPVQERPVLAGTSGYEMIHTPQSVEHIPAAVVLNVTPVTTVAVPAVAITSSPGIRTTPASSSRPVLQYIGVRPSYRFAGEPYYQLQLTTRSLNT